MSTLARRSVARLALAVLVAPLAIFAVAVLLAPWSSWSGRAYALAIVGVEVGLALRARRRIVRIAVGLGFVVVVLRLFVAASGETVSMRNGDGAGRLLTRVFDERDAAVWGAYLAFGTGHFRDPDVPDVPAALKRAYAELATREGDVPSPVVPTYLGLERPGASDVLSVALPNGAAPRGALVFLHGFGGSFTLPCVHVAAAAAAAGFTTRCPSMGPRADWWSASGETIVRETLESLHAEGIDRVVLAGLSNGGAGVARLAPRLRGKLRGVILISGTAPADAPGVPCLVLQGKRDAMMPASGARAYASAVHGRFVELDAGHFALLLRRETATVAITDFLSTR
ncbi:MAG: hypothetical protein U0235_06700 [Polyangiaceae bacterium]